MARAEDEPLDFEGEDEEEDSPKPQGRLYITTTGAERLRSELRQLLNVERPKVTSEVTAAAAQGDRSENAEYIYGKKRLREIDRRLRFLTKRLELCTVVDPREQKDSNKVYFGATVTLENEEDGTQTTYQIVGPDEIDTKAGKISVDSPVGRALLGRKKGESVTVVRPRGEVELTVLAIAYR
jgi:transcription elongation factor GreB